MTLWNTFIISYGLIMSPLVGWRLVKWRWNEGLKTGKDLVVYLLVGFAHWGMTFYAMTLLPEDSWLRYPGMFIMFFYLAAYGAAEYNVRM